MSRRDNPVVRLTGKPKDATRDEPGGLPEESGCSEAATGKTGGSRRRFVHDTAPTIAVHKPHPGNIVKMYAIGTRLRVPAEEGPV